MNSKILVVDDEETIRSMIQKYLQGMGYEVHEADSFQAAIEMIQANEYDIMVTDKNMPHPDGTEESGMSLMEYAAKHHPHIEILLMTGFPTIETAVESIRMGAFDYLTKPFSMAALKEKIERILEYKSYAVSEDIMGTYKDFQNIVLQLISRKSQLSFEEFNNAMDNMAGKIGYLLKSQDKLMKNNRKQQDALDKIADMSKDILEAISDKDPAYGLAERILKESRY